MGITTFHVKVSPSWQGLQDCILRKGTPDRVYFLELMQDPEIKDQVGKRFPEIASDLDKGDPFYDLQREAAIQQFLGYDFVRCGLEGVEIDIHKVNTGDTAGRDGGRSYVDEHSGPIGTWEDFEKFDWPDPATAGTRSFEWYQENLPAGMCVVTKSFGHFAEYLTWLFGYEKLCYALFDNRDLVRATSDRLIDINKRMLERILQFDRVRFIWASDDMGFKSGTLISPDDLREFVLPGHKLMAHLAHQAGRPYLLHSCGNLEQIMDDLIDDVKIDGKHSYEDTIMNEVEAKKKYGNRIGILGGIDLDFLCRSTEQQIRERVRATLQANQPGGGYCLGSGNSIANYIPLDNYLAMLDEGRKFAN